MTTGRPRRGLHLAALAIVGLAGAVRHADVAVIYSRYGWLLAASAAAFGLSVAQWAVAILERPVTGWSARLDALRVVVCVPVYNEDPATLDRVLYALAAQTRPPDTVHVVDDGSAVCYDRLQRHWQSQLGRRLTWTRQPNRGKKAAQAVCFGSHPAADIFVTIDSDTTLTRQAILEGLRPFRRRDVWSVAGVELAWNHSRNWVTLMGSARQLCWQLITCSAQSVAGGDVTVNRGTFALYRAAMIRDVLPAYVGEKFLGRRIKLGDDAALTLFAQCRGRAVQQPTAICLPMYPESLSHHFRQWLRWMRGSTIRTCWRLRYLPLASWSWWFTLISTWLFTVSAGTTVVIAVTWPRSQPYAAAVVLATMAWSVLTALRTTTIRRSDQNWLDRLTIVLMAPFSALWVILVLRPLRVFGILTFLRQGWVTRRSVEIADTAAPGEAA